MLQSSRVKNRLITTAIVTGILLAAGGASAAYAQWSAAGFGSGTGSTGTSGAFTVAVSGTSGGPLSPGGATETIAFTVANTGSASAMLTTVDVRVAAANGSAWTSAPGCSALDYSLGTPVFSTGQVPGGSTVSGTVTLTMRNLNQSQDGCKGVNVPLFFTAS